MEENTPSQSEQGQESGHDFQANQVKDDDVPCETRGSTILKQLNSVQMI